MSELVKSWRLAIYNEKFVSFNNPFVGIDEDERTFGLSLGIPQCGYHDITWR